MARRRLPAKIAWTANSKQTSGNRCTYRTNAKQGGPEIAVSETTANQFRAEEDALGDVQVPVERPAAAHAQRMPRSAFLTYADYRILDFSLIISPSTANLPYP